MVARAQGSAIGFVRGYEERMVGAGESVGKGEIWKLGLRVAFGPGKRRSLSGGALKGKKSMKGARVQGAEKGVKMVVLSYKMLTWGKSQREGGARFCNDGW